MSIECKTLKAISQQELPPQIGRLAKFQTRTTLSLKKHEHVTISDGNVARVTNDPIQVSGYFLVELELVPDYAEITHRTYCRVIEATKAQGSGLHLQVYYDKIELCDIFGRPYIGTIAEEDSKQAIFSKIDALHLKAFATKE